MQVKPFAGRKVLYGLLLALLVLITITLVSAATPNPGHPWTEVGDGTFQVTGPTALRTYTFPDANATVLTNANAVTVSQGGTGTTSLTGVVIGNGTSAFTATSILTSANGGTGNGFAKFSGPATSEKTFTLPNASAAVLTDNAAVTLAQGGTGASLTASNGGIFYSTGSAGAILAGTATAGQILRSGASAAPSWSTATYPATAGASGNVLVSDGTNWASTPAAIITVLTNPYMTTGAVAGVAAGSRTVRNVGLFNVPARITVNQLTFNVVSTSNPATGMKVCVYSEDGATRLIDVTSASVGAAGNFSVTVSPAVTLSPGNYYVAIGCATTCNDTVNMFTSGSAAWVNGANVPSGKRIYEGTVTHTQDTCNTSLGTITAASSLTPAVRLDN